MNKKLIVILGMHRSGSSLIARCTKIFGAEFGDNIIPPGPDNPTGFWEDRDILKLDIEMLSALKMDWNHTKAIGSSEIDILNKQGFLERSLEILQNRLNIYPFFTIKDPRMAKLIPFWKQVFNCLSVEIYYIITLRNPSSVIISLKRRNNIETLVGAILWIEHVLSSYQATYKENTIIIDYDLFIENPKEEIEKISNNFLFSIKQNEFHNFTENFMDKKLRHSYFKTSNLFEENNIYALAEEIYNKLKRQSQKTIISYKNYSGLEFKEWNIKLNNFNCFFKTIDKYLQKEEENLNIIENYRKNEEENLNIIENYRKNEEEILDLNKNTINECNEKISNLELFIENQYKDIIELNNSIEKNRNIIDKYERECESLRIFNENNLKEKDEILKNIQKNSLTVLDKINDIESISSYNLQNFIKLNEISKFNFSCSIIKLNKFYKKRTFSKYREYRLLKKLCQSNNNIFDHDWYIKQYPDIKKIRNPLRHYFMHGAYENRNPNPYFDSMWYIKKYNDVAENKINPLLHYIQYGWIEGRDPSPYFNTTWYTNQYKDVKENHINPLLHFLNYGDQEGRNPNPYFDAQWYKSSYEEVRLSGIHPFLHYITIGFKERKNPSPYFDTNWYLSVNDDVRESGMDPLLHYMLYGWHEGRDPNPYFDSKWYVKKYPEALVSSCSPLLHYIESGKSNWKNPNKFFDSKWYLATYPEVKKTKTDPLLHFICHGVVEKKNPSPSFDVNWYLEEYQDVKQSGLNPLFHYMHYGQHEGRLTKSKIPIRIEINEKSQIGILHTPHTKYLADQIAISLNKLSINSFLLQEKPEEGFNECIHFVLCPQMFLELPKKYIAYQMEQSVNPRWFTSEYYSILDNALAIIDYSTHNIEFLRNDFQLRDNQLYYVPVDYIDINKNLYKNQCESYDVLFYGDLSCERRKLFLENLGKHFNIKIINNTFGEDLYKEISKAKIIINIHYYENALLETTRLWECLSLEKLIVSEKSIDFEEHEDLFNLIDFVDIGDVNSMIKKIKYWLQNDKCRRDYIDKNRNTLTDRVNKFEYFFFRFMLANENISFDYFWRICGKNITLEKEKIVCLTLPEFSERKKIFKENNPVQVHFFDGLRHYKNGWIGCGMSYKLMIKLAKKQNFKNITICEDDVKFLDDFENRFTDIKIGLETTIHPWDIFSGFMSDVSQDIVIKKIIKFGEQEVLIVNKIISMVFNCYNHTSYDSIINWNETNLDVNLNTIDRFLEQQDNLTIFLSFPFLAEHKDDLQSTIWGFNNTQYNHLINRSVRLLQKKVFVKKIVGNSHTM